MRIVSCYIRAFGILEDARFEFEEGINQYLCRNGAGKTTLLAFIRAMFFGLEYNQSRSAKFYERIHYTPWSGKACGGSLVFSIEGMNYRIERTFGRKRPDDTCVVYDEASGKISDRYSDDVGEVLFGVDKESFEKSVFFGQGDLSTGVTGSMNAKMGNLSDVQDDINRFEDAINRIDKERANYERKSPKNPGFITEINTKIKACEGARDKIPVLENAMKDRKKSIDDKKKRLDEIRSKREEVSKSIKEAGERIQLEGVLDEKRRQYEELKLEQSKRDEFLGGRVPEDEQIERIQAADKSLLELQSRIDEIKARLPLESDREFLISIYGGGNPATKELIDKSTEDMNELIRLRAVGESAVFSEENEKALAEEKEFFAEGIPTDEEIDEYRKRVEKLTEAEAKIRILRGQREEQEQEIRRSESERALRSGIGNIVLSAVGVIIALASVLILLFIPGPFFLSVGCLIGIIGGAFLTILGFIFARQKRLRSEIADSSVRSRYEDLSSKLESASSQLSVIKEQCYVFVNRFIKEEGTDLPSAIANIQRRRDHYESLMTLYTSLRGATEERADALAELTMDLYTRLSTYGEAYGYDLFKDHKENELLSRMKEDIKRYDDYLSDMTKLKEFEQEAQKLEEEIKNFIDRYNWLEDKSVTARLSELKVITDNYNSARQRLLALEEELKDSQKPDEDEKAEVSLESLQQIIKELDEETEPLLADITREEGELEGKVYETEELEEAARELESLIERRDEMKRRVEILNATKDCLIKAKEEFLSVYMTPLRERMKVYIDGFLEEETNAYPEVTLDMDLSVRLMQDGSTHVADYLSEGLRDLTMLCTRLALIDILYTKERPVILMDDPFTNLDKEKTQRALKILNNISGESQIIYMTCHESRAGDYKTFGL